ncbi:low affinity sulfate transporter 3 [Iris pallida]|uniref:Low affinity sulfate transporter 3 n=1 Tax=Iris pallida TaxID=29817 RepID=A0AAX6GW89_IRIPA|nr:low affinity sulfate transporter 3 [Iris pallida]
MSASSSIASILPSAAMSCTNRQAMGVAEVSTMDRQLRLAGERELRVLPNTSTARGPLRAARGAQRRRAGQDDVDQTVLFSVLDTREPPSPWHDLAASVRSAVSRCRSEYSPRPFGACLGSPQPLSDLRWGSSYDLKSFRSDLLAGLTRLASAFRK